MKTTQAVRRALAGLCLVASLTAVACSSSGSGSTATATRTPVHQEVPEGRFSAEFPGAPVRDETRTTANGIDLVIVSYTTETAEESVLVGYTDYPKNVQLPKVLDAAAEGSAAKINGTIQSKSATTLMGHPAMDIVVKADGALVHERLVLRGNRLYTLVGVAASGRPASYDRLVETFVLI